MKTTLPEPSPANFCKSAILPRSCGDVERRPRQAHALLLSRRFHKDRLIVEERITIARYARGMDNATRSGIVMQQSKQSVDDTVRKLRELLKNRGITLFAVIDHSGEAEKVGMHMPNTKLIVFGNPRAGTPIMLAAPSAALDLPLKILVSEDASEGVWLSYSSPTYLEIRHGFPAELVQSIVSIEDLAKRAAE